MGAVLFFFSASHATQRGLLPNSALCPCVPQGGSRADDIELPTVFSRRQSPSTHLHHFLFRLCLYMARRLGSFSFETVVKTDGRRPTVAPCKLTSIPRATVDRPERHRLSFFFFSFVLKSSDAYLRQNCAIHFSDDVIRRDDRNLVAFFFLFVRFARNAMSVHSITYTCLGLSSLAECHDVVAFATFSRRLRFPRSQNFAGSVHS